MKMKSVRYEKDYKRFLKKLELSRQKLKEYMKAMPFEKKLEILKKNEGVFVGA